MPNPYQVFHSTCDLFREKLHVVLVRPEFGGNVGSTARAMANMGIRGELRIVGTPGIINEECWKFAKHARSRIENARYFSSLKEALTFPSASVLSLASTARVGSAHRPHPIRVGDALSRAVDKLATGQVRDVAMVFGSESDGLTNEEIELCDWVVTIPSSDEYRSLNLAQAVLIFSYEANRQMLREWEPYQSAKPSQKQRLITHLLSLAAEVGFVMPGDPFKMRPRLEEIFSHLPNHIKDVKTLHGLIDQTIRSVQRGAPDLKGRYRRIMENGTGKEEVPNERST